MARSQEPTSSFVKGGLLDTKSPAAFHAEYVIFCLSPDRILGSSSSVRLHIGWAAGINSCLPIEFHSRDIHSTNGCQGKHLVHSTWMVIYTKMSLDLNIWSLCMNGLWKSGQYPTKSLHWNVCQDWFSSYHPLLCVWKSAHSGPHLQLVWMPTPGCYSWYTFQGHQALTRAA